MSFTQDSENSSKIDATAASTENGVKQTEDDDNQINNGTDTTHLITQSVPKTIPNGFASDTATATAVMQPIAAIAIATKQFIGSGDHNGHHHQQQQQQLLHNGYHSTKHQVSLKCFF